MNQQVEGSAALDSIQEHLTSYASSLAYRDLTPEAIHAAKVRIIDTLGALISGFFAEPCRIARNMAAEMPDPGGATIIGTRMKTRLDMAAFANAVAARFMELTDTYHWPGSFGGHPSDVVAPLLCVAERAQANGRDYLTSVVLAYEVYLRINDVFRNMGFDQTIFACLATAVGSGKLLALSSPQLANCISMAVVPNNTLRLVRMGRLSMWKAAASGQAGWAGVFAAQLARAGMEGPRLPFEGESGWCDHVALERFSLGPMGGNGVPFKIPHTSIKLRPSGGLSIASILAAEKLAPVPIQHVKQVTVEVNRKAKNYVGTGEHAWNPDTREAADHSLPYIVGSALMDGTITPRSYSDSRLRNPELRALMQKIAVVENPEFTAAYARVPAEHKARVTIVMNDGLQRVAESGGGADNLSAPKSDVQIESKFRELTEDHLGAKRVNSVLDCLWRLEALENVNAIPPQFVMV